MKYDNFHTTRWKNTVFIQKKYLNFLYIFYVILNNSLITNWWLHHIISIDLNIRRKYSDRRAVKIQKICFTAMKQWKIFFSVKILNIQEKWKQAFYFISNSKIIVKISNKINNSSNVKFRKHDWEFNRFTSTICSIDNGRSLITSKVFIPSNK